MADQITVSVDADVARAYRTASDDERRKLDLLVNLRLRDATGDEDSLRDIMLDISRKAAASNLSPHFPLLVIDQFGR